MIEVKTKAEQALERQASWAKLTPAQQLNELDRRLGKGVGAKKQRAKLTKILKMIDPMPEVVKQSAVVEAPIVTKEKKKAKDRRAEQR